MKTFHQVLKNSDNFTVTRKEFIVIVLVAVFGFFTSFSIFNVFKRSSKFVAGSYGYSQYGANTYNL